MCSIEELIQMSDEEFYEKHLADLSLEEQAAFFTEFPDFLREEPIADEAGTDKVYQELAMRLKK